MRGRIRRPYNNFFSVNDLDAAIVTIHPPSSGGNERGIYPHVNRSGVTLECLKGRGKALTMPAAQAPHMIGDTIELVPVWRNLGAGVVGRNGEPSVQLPLVCAWGQRRWHVVRQIEAFQREVDRGLNLIGEWSFDLESLQMDEKNWRETRQGKLLGGGSQSLAVWTVPAWIVRYRRSSSWIINGTNQASACSITSSERKLSKHLLRGTLVDPLPDGTGRVRYMKEL
jgi:hypothetical protein